MGRRFALMALLLFECCLCAATGCGGDGELTELILVVDTTLDTPLEADAIEVTVEGPTSGPHIFEAPLAGPAAVSFPITLGLSPAGDRLEPVTITAEATVTNPDMPAVPVHVVERRVRTGFVLGERRLVRLLLLGACVSVECPAGQTCVEGGRCQPFEVAGTSLPLFHGVPPSPDRRDLCAAGMAQAATTVGCNGPPVSLFAGDTEFGGRCVRTDAEPCMTGGICMAPDEVNGICLLPCDPGPTYVSTGGCPDGARCFDLPGGALCYPDCRMPSDCKSGICDREGSCRPPSATDGGVDGGADAGPPAGDAG